LKALFIIIADDFKREIRSKSIILLFIIFIICPIFINFSLIFLNRPDLSFLAMGTHECVLLLNETNFSLFFFNFTIIGCIFAIIKATPFFAPNLKSGTIKIFLSLPIRRIELYTSQFIEFLIQITIFSFLGWFFTNLIWSLICSGFILAFLLVLPSLVIYSLTTILFLMAIFSFTTFINMVGSNVTSVIISMLLFLIYPLFLFNQILSGIFLMVMSGLRIDGTLFVQITRFLYLIRLDFHAYSMLGNLIPEIGLMDFRTNLTLNTFQLLYLEDFFYSFCILLSFFIIPFCLGLLYFLYKDIKE